jgi:hypothetical protein
VLASLTTSDKIQLAVAVVTGVANARVEAINTKIRLITRRAFGFHSPDALIALAMLTLGGLCPPLPGRPPDPRKRHKTPKARSTETYARAYLMAAGWNGRLIEHVLHLAERVAARHHGTGHSRWLDGDRLVLASSSPTSHAPRSPR